MDLTTSLRSATLTDLVEVLRKQADAKYDVVVPAARLAYDAGHLIVKGGAARFDETGVEEADAVLAPTDIFDDGVSDRLGIPRGYLRRMRDERDDAGLLLDANVNGWLEQEPQRRFLVRAFRTDDPDDIGIARSLLSDRFRPIDNLDVLMAALDGVNRAGVNVEVDGGDLSERRMSLRLTCPEVSAVAPRLLSNYRSPFNGDSGADLPLVFAGFVVQNGENGGAAFTVVPRVVVQVCKNGMTVTRDAMRQVHLGGRLEEGVVRWSDDTQRKNLELVTAQASDAVSTFLDPDYLETVVAGIEEQADAEVDDAPGTIERIGRSFGFSEAEQASILDAFIRSGDVSAGGVMQAVTATAQELDDPDRASDLEDMALAVLEEVATG